MMDRAGLLFILYALVGVLVAEHHPHPGGTSIICRDCKETRHPEDCKTFRNCPEPCKTEVHHIDGHYTFSFGCSGHHGCHDQPEPHHLIGKRHGPHEEGQQVCQECCNSTYCDSHTCSSYRKHTTTTTTTTTTTPAPTTKTTTMDPKILDPGCRDYESDTFHCSEFVAFHLCSDTSSIGHALALTKCRKHCGFCNPYVAPTTMHTSIPSGTQTAATVSVTQATCADHEVQDFNCAEWKSFGFCSQGSGAAYTIAEERCKKTCGICH